MLEKSQGSYIYIYPESQSPFFVSKGLSSKRSHHSLNGAWTSKMRNYIIYIISIYRHITRKHPPVWHPAQ